ncbi:MAG: hypothetical protein V1863_04390 [Candidatus Omnitrophota bacterium]
MPEAPLTPEEKLLRIIESPPGKVHPLRSKKRLPELKFSLKQLKSQYKERAKAFLNLKTANGALTFVSGAVTVFLAIDFWIGLPRASALQHLEATAKKQDIGSLTMENLDPVTLYLQEITQRNIFALVESDQPGMTEAAAAQAVVKTLNESLRVVGIIWSDAAPQVIMEDIQEGRTHLLNRGAKIREARVKDILKDRVILSYDNQDIELR